MIIFYKYKLTAKFCLSFNVPLPPEIVHTSIPFCSNPLLFLVGIKRRFAIILGNIKTNLAYASTVLLASSALVFAQYTIPRSGFRWKNNSGPLAQPANGWTSLKNFTVVPYQGKYFVYGTKYQSPNYGSINFALVSNLRDLNSVRQTDINSGTVAPTLFYFTPKNIWILVYQWGATPFNYRTSIDPTNATVGPRFTRFFLVPSLGITLAPLTKR